MIEKTGMIESKPSTVWPVAARRAISSGSRLASGNGASTRSISSTVAIEVGLHERRAVDRLAAQRGQHALAARHGRRGLRGLAHS